MLPTLVVRTITAAISAVVVAAAAQGSLPSTPRGQHPTFRIEVPQNPLVATPGRRPYDRLFVMPGFPEAPRAQPLLEAAPPQPQRPGSCGLVFNGRTDVDRKMIFAVPAGRFAIQRIEPPVCGG